MPAERAQTVVALDAALDVAPDAELHEVQVVLQRIRSRTLARPAAAQAVARLLLRERTIHRKRCASRRTLCTRSLGHSLIEIDRICYRCSSIPRMTPHA